MGNSKRSSADHQAILATLKTKLSAASGCTWPPSSWLRPSPSQIPSRKRTPPLKRRSVSSRGSGPTPACPATTQGTVGYPHDPGAGGDHSATWTNCGIYTEPISEERADHSLEHGALWLTYNPSLPPAGINKLGALAKDKPYVLPSPNSDPAAPVTATAWGTRLALQDADDSHTPAFTNSYAPKAPEPSAPCTRGADG